MPVGPYSQDVLTRIYNVHWEDGPSGANFSLGFSATPAGFYKDGTPTLATLSVVGLPLLSPNTFQVNLPEGAIMPPFFPGAYYGGHTEMTSPYGESGTLTAGWSFQQNFGTGTAHGGVDYGIEGAPLEGNVIQIKVVMNLRELDFLGTGSADNHYEWSGFAMANIPGIGTPEGPMSKSGRAETGATLTFILDVVMDPPSATFTAAVG